MMLRVQKKHTESRLLIFLGVFLGAKQFQTILYSKWVRIQKYSTYLTLISK